MSNYPAALADFDQALELKPDYADAMVQIGLVYFKQENYLTAISYLSDAIEIDAENVEAYSYRGFTRIALENYDLAIQDFDLVIQLMPEIFVGYLGRGLAYYYSGYGKEALRDLREYERLVGEENVNPLYIPIIEQLEGQGDG